MNRLAAVLLGMLTVGAEARPDAFVIQPGRGFGAFRATMSLAEIEKRLKPGEFGEGTSDGKPDAVIYMMDPDKRITLLLDAHQKIRSMSVHGLSGPWHTREGIGLGTHLDALQKLNGRPLHFHSFSGATAGQIVDWGGGKLARLLPRVTITFATPMHARGYGAMSSADKLLVEKEGLVMSSADRAARQLNPLIETIELRF